MRQTPRARLKLPPGQVVPLPTDFSDRGLTVEDAIERRRSVRDFPGHGITLVELSRLLHRASGITEQTSGYRAAPSAGALYPLEPHVVTNSVEGLPVASPCDEDHQIVVSGLRLEGFDAFARELLERMRGREEVRKAA